MRCPHCRVEVHSHTMIAGIHPHHNPIGSEGGKALYWHALSMACPACDGPVIILRKAPVGDAESTEWIAYPRNSNRVKAPPEVPGYIAEDFNEAGAVLDISPKASAALSRRCLQALLREQGFANKDLAPAIQSALESKTLPSGYAADLDAIRNIGNFAAHPMKDELTGTILPVEPHEAEWNLEVLEGLFDHYYVQPMKAAQRRDALNQKLALAGKPAMKTPTL